MALMKNDSLKSIALLWGSLADSFCISNRSISTFERRLSAEGETFLFKTLTSLGQDFMRTVITGEPLLVTSRFRLKRNCAYPVFLSELFEKVLTNEGTLIGGCNPINIKHIRQLCFMCYKTEVPFIEESCSEFLKGFIERDMSLSSELPHDSYMRRARSLIARVLSGLDPLEIVPRHGSGVTACRTPNHDKYHEFKYIASLDAVYPYSEYFFYSPAHLCDKLHKLTGALEIKTPEARLAFVPKDQRGPRIICCEPLEHQYIQQGIMRLLYRRVESHFLTKGFVNFTDQRINQKLALAASLNGEWATLDLKDASDYVRNDLVMSLFPSNWNRAMQSCRTSHVRMPDKTKYGPLRKFAPMGSALCFPVQALTYWSLLRGCLGIRDVYVYGDDIIIPAAYANAAMHVLEMFNLKVNSSKSCYKTPFRESCGGDYFDGVDVGYVKLRHVPDDSIESHVSMVAFANNIGAHYDANCMSRICGIVDDLYGPHYNTDRGYSLTYRREHRSSDAVFFKHRWNKDTQTLEVYIQDVYAPKRLLRSAPLHHWGELLRYTCEGASESYTCGEYTCPGTAVKYGWRAA